MGSRPGENAHHVERVNPFRPESEHGEGGRVVAGSTVNEAVELFETSRQWRVALPPD